MPYKVRILEHDVICSEVSDVLKLLGAVAQAPPSKSNSKPVHRGFSRGQLTEAVLATLDGLGNPITSKAIAERIGARPSSVSACCAVLIRYPERDSRRVLHGKTLKRVIGGRGGFLYFLQRLPPQEKKDE